MKAKNTVVLIPGLLCDRALWRHQISALEAQAEIIVPDLAAYKTIHDMANHVLDSVGSPDFSLCGLSMGGYVSFEIMRLAPERVDRLALIATSAQPDDRTHVKRRQLLISQARRGKFKGVTPKILPQLISHINLSNTSLTAELMEMASRTGRDTFIRHQTAIIGRPDSRAILGEIMCPTLVVCGVDDKWTPPEYSQEISDGIPRSKLVLVNDCGHLPPMEQPETISNLLWEWLGW